jgi:hypothetical protein
MMGKEWSQHVLFLLLGNPKTRLSRFEDWSVHFVGVFVMRSTTCRVHPLQRIAIGLTNALVCLGSADKSLLRSVVTDVLMIIRQKVLTTQLADGFCSVVVGIECNRLAMWGAGKGRIWGGGWIRQTNLVALDLGALASRAGARGGRVYNGAVE